MDISTYTYDGQFWRPSPTVSDKDSFFHSAFGVRTDESEPYFDKQAKFKRMRWSAFLTYFENESMPSCLADTLKKCFSANDRYRDVSVEDKNQFARYIYDIMFSDESVSVEEIPIIATLENIKVTILCDSVSRPVTVIRPNIELLGSYSNSSERPKEVVLSLQGNMFSRLEPADEGTTKSDYSVKTVQNKCPKETVQRIKDFSIKYNKSGSAGSKGVEFQVSLLTVFLLNAMERRLNDWRLSSENMKAGKFDDVVLECSEGDVLLQAKYRENKIKKVTLEDLMSVNSRNDEFSLPKYFLSYQGIKDNFNIKNVLICTNTSLHCTVLKFTKTRKVCPQSMLHHEGGICSFHTFEGEILPRLKENVKIYLEKNVKKKDVNATVITDENLQDFLSRLQFYSDFPAGSDLEKIMEQLLSRMNLHRQTTYLEVYAKVMNWFQQKGGIYLNETFAKAIFLEIWRDKYWQVLEQYKVYFQNNDLDFQRSSRIIHVATDDGYFLQELKLYRALKDREKILYLHCDDVIDMRNQVTESFRLSQYVLLIIIWPQFKEEEATRSICEELKEILHKYEYKRVIAVTKQNSKMIPQIHDDHTVIRGSVSFEDFSKDTRERLLTKRNLEFQGRCISLEELFANHVIEDYGKAVNSELLEKIVKDEKITVGLPLLGLDKNTSRFYITRQFKKRIKENERKKWEFSNPEENLSEESIFNINKKLILISDIAGMGKSTTLTNLATTIKEKYPDFWVIRIQLTGYTTILKILLENNNTKTTNVMDLLNSKPTTEFTNQLEKFVFTLHEKVVLMLDGIDEISPDYTDLVLKMIIECQDATNFLKLFVTTRPHTANDLQIKLGVKPFVLQPFSEENQVQFFTSYWAHNLQLDDRDKERCEQYARALINRMLTWMKVYQEENNFAGVPLQARMLAEIFQESNNWADPTDWEGCREFLSTNVAEPKLPEEINITRLYEMFIERKRKIFMDKGNPSGNTAANEALNDKFNQSLLNHRNLALEMVLDKNKCKFFSSYRTCEEDSGTNPEKMGIVHKVNNEFHFIHRTFAEYFVGASLLKELNNQNLEFQKFLIDEVLLNLEYSMICAFFDSFLHNIVDSLPSTTFQHYQSLKNGINLNERYKSNLIFRLAEEGYVATLQLIFKCIEFKIITDKAVLIMDLYETDFNQEDFDIRRHIFSNTLNMLQYFVSRGGVNIKNEEGKTPLHLASQRGHLGMVKYLISQGANIESKDFDGHTPLHSAVYYGQFDVTKFLVEQGANINARDNNGRCIPHESIIGSQVNIASYLLDNILKQDGLDVKNPMIPYMAAFLGRLDILQVVIEKDLDINCLLEGEETLITVAALGNQLDTIKYLRDQGADINLTDSDGNTALHVAALEGQLDIVRFLILKCGIDVNIRNHSVGTPLNLAILSGHLDTIKFLIEHGANAHIRDNHGETVLHLASLMGRWDIVRYLVLEVGFRINVTNKNGCTPLHLAVSKSQLDIVKFFVGQGADINARDNNGRTPLHSVIRAGRLDTVSVLVVEYKADIYVRDKDGRTALHLAAQQGELHISEFLIRSGANIHVTDNAGLTAVHLAASEGKLDVVKLFLNLCVDINIRDGKGRTLLHIAAPWNQLETMKFLIVEYDLDIDAVDDDKRTALHSASERGRIDSVVFLVENGANVYLKDDSDCTALHLAASNGHLGIVKFLAERGADIHAAENSGRTALHLAALKDHLNVVEFLVDRGVDLNAKDKEGCSALKLADSRANRDITVYLVECGADVDALLSIFD